jgi:hypothetical protein
VRTRRTGHPLRATSASTRPSRGPLAEPGGDVRPREPAGERERGGVVREAHRPRRRRGHDGQEQVDERADHHHVRGRPDARPDAERHRRGDDDHAARTLAAPMPMPRCRWSPAWNASHGPRPSPERTMRATASPHPKKPKTSSAHRRRPAGAAAPAGAPGARELSRRGTRPS